MERLTRPPWGPFAMSAVLTVATLVAIAGFGAPPWILLPVTVAGATLNAEMDNRVRGRSGRH
jgi:hypothetical protein